MKWPLAAALAAFFLAMLFLEGMGSAVVAAFSGFFAAYLFFALKPARAEKKRAEEFEKDFPFALLAMSVELNLGVSFEKALQSIASGDFGLCSREFAKALKEIREQGSSVQESLARIAESVASLDSKRAISQIATVYELSGKHDAGMPLRKTANEMLSKQRAKAKEFSGKLVVLALVFIAASAILPAFFQAFIVVGSMFLNLELSALQVLAVSVIVFPAVDLMLLFYIRAKTPLFLRE